MGVHLIHLRTGLLVVLNLVSVAAFAEEAERRVDFRRGVLPILSENCFACHGFDEGARESGLRLDVAEGAFTEADSGVAAIVPGSPDDSELMTRVASDDPDYRMPPPATQKTLTKDQQRILRTWIREGAVFQKHWSFEKPVTVHPPTREDTEHPIDRFVRSRLDDVGLTASPIASDTTLLRRLKLDLIGLPPTLEEIDWFLEAAQRDRDAAYDQVVDRLLESPHYGERWGRWWLDQARYADSNGYSIDAPRSIWKYRDWVIESLNDDVPFDQFTREQLAGDLLANATQDQLVATGFHRNTQINQEGGIDKEQFRVDSVFDRVATTGTVWLGLTIGCAQCHDHKFDPISQKEYYQLFAFFNNQDEPSIKVYDDPGQVPARRQELRQVERQLDALMAAHAEAFGAWEREISNADRVKFTRRVQTLLDLKPEKRDAAAKRALYLVSIAASIPGFRQLEERRAQLDAELNRVPTSLVMRERKEPRESTVLIKGDFTRPSESVQPGTPSVLHSMPAGKDDANRLDLAQWITSPDNPLTARVIVNRVWQVYFGRGIVETENDFGTLGSLPSHPRLLDWLAMEFQQRRWSLKELHRLIVTSDTYQQSSLAREDLARVDPNNYLLGRQQRLRLEAEIIRDVCLSASGLLSGKIGGPPVYPPIPKGVMNRGQVNRHWQVSKGEDRYRRGIYTFVYRATPPPFLNVFDAPDGYSTCTRRSRSNTPLQALTLLNDGAFVEFAGALAARIDDLGLEAAFRLCTGRRPSAEEARLLTALDSKSAARVLLNLDETMTRE